MEKWWKSTSFENDWSSISSLQYSRQWLSIRFNILVYIFLGKSFGPLLAIIPENFIYLKTFNSEILFVQVWFTVQNHKSLQIEDKISVTLVIN